MRLRRQRGAARPCCGSWTRKSLTPTHLLLTHGHADHVAGNDRLVERFGIPIERGRVETGGLVVDALPVPGHSDDGVAFVVNETVVFTGDRSSAAPSAVTSRPCAAR